MVFSCKNETAKESMNHNNEEVDKKASNLDDLVEPIEIEVFSNQQLINEKLHVFYELRALQNSHPKFAQTIAMQLQKYTSDTIPPLTKKTISIGNIAIGDEIISLSDSLQKLKVYYNIESENLTKKDSIYALITTIELLIDDEIKTSKKVRFETIKN